MAIALKLKHTKDDPVRLSFPDLFKPVEFKAGDGKPRYNASYLVVPGGANDKLIRAAIAAAIAEKVDAKKVVAFTKAVEGQGNKYCYVSGDTKEYDGYAGTMVLTSHRRAQDGKPGVFDCTRAGPDGKPLPLDQESGKPYAGCYVNASLDIYAQEGENPGVRCGLKGTFFAADGDAFSGSAAAKGDDFDIEEGSNADDLA